MTFLDWIIVLLYLIVTMAIGIFLTRKGVQSLKDLIGGSFPWWLAGTSMAATTFSIDTPLYICGVVATRGIAGNWEWWSFGISHVILIYLFARVWRRSEMLTDAQLIELRYGGKMAKILRTSKAFLFAVPINCIGIGYVMLAMVKVVDALQIWDGFGLDIGENQKIWTVIGVSIFVLVYCGISGLTGVVLTDFFQFFLGLFGAIIVAIIAVNSVGGMHQLIPQVQAATNIDVLAFIPLHFGDGGLTWSDTAGITMTTFSAYLFVQWWSFRRSDGGGEFIQRILASKDEREAEKGTWFFVILHYVIRTWPWIVVALVAIIVYPNLEDPELGYPRLMLDFLPIGLLGLVVASLIAAFMSTVSTAINWGASYLANDIYLPLVYPNYEQENDSLESEEIKQKREAELVLVTRIASVLVTALGGVAAFYFSDISTVFRLVIAIGTGPGLVLILRWFWWRINAAAELAAMIAGFLVGLITTLSANVNQLLPDFGTRLMIISAITALIWITVMYLTPPESEETLDRFYEKVYPSGFWNGRDLRLGFPQQDFKQDVLRVIAATLFLFGIMFTVGGFLLLKSATGWLSLIIAVIGGFWLRRLNKQTIVKPIPRPGILD